MKFKTYLYLGAALAIFAGGHLAQADTITAEPSPLTAQEQSLTAGKFLVTLEDQQAKLIFMPEQISFHKVKAEVWTKEDKSDVAEMELQLNDEGQYVAFLPQKKDSNQQTFYVDVTAETQDETVYRLQNYTFEWQVDTISSSSTSGSSSDTTAGSSAISSSSDDANSQSSQTGIASAQRELARGTLSIQNHNLQAGTFDVIVSNVSNTEGVKAVKIPVWTEENGQDDIKWYTATKQSDGTYKLTVDKKNHKNGQGKYHVHLYYENNNGEIYGVASTTTSLQLTGTISATNVNMTAGTFDVVIQNIGSPFPIKAVKVPIWTTENGQDDIKWYTANRQADGSYKLTVDKKNHKNGSGEYNLHLYYEFENAPMQGIASTKTALSTPSTGTVNVTNYNLQAGSFDVVVSNVQSSAAIKSVKIPVWTEENGQDDIKWYTANHQADGTYKLTVQKSNHKNGVGFYQAHVYYEYSDGKIEGITSTRAALSTQGTVKISNLDTQKGSFDVIVSDIVSPSTIKAVKVPIWTEENGQDDIKWYTATKQNDGTYKVNVQKSNHKNGTGVYQVHLYYEYDNQLLGIASTSASLTTKSSGTVSVKNINNQAGTFDVVVSNITSSSPLQSVQIPVWTEENGQDDIKWYTTTKQNDGTYKLTVDKKNHKNGAGNYQIHVYYKYTNGKMEGITSTKTNLPEATVVGKITIANHNTAVGTFDVIISDIVAPKELDTVQVPVWSEKNDQDDLVWYTATKQANGTYKVTVQASNHKYDTGAYQVHTYIIQKDGSMTGIGSTKTNVAITETTPSATVAVTNVNNTYGVFDVVVSNVFAPNGVDTLQIPVWGATDDKNDIHWYTAEKQTDGTYKITVRIANHKYETGVYNAHVYITSGGTLYGVGTATGNVTYSIKSGLGFIDVSSHNGAISVSEYRNLLNQGVTGVVVKLTEGTYYTNPEAKQQIANAQAVGLKVSVYHYSHFSTTAQAQAEAEYFVAAAKKLGLKTDTLMVNDIEDVDTKVNSINSNMKAWETTMKSLGYNNLVHYSMASMVDVGGFSGEIKTSNFGLTNFWIAHYPKAGLTFTQANQMSYYSNAAAWQFSSTGKLLSNHGYFDLNIDYTGRFTN